VEAKFAKEEEKSFHIHLPRFLLYFIVGLIINPIQWVVRKGKGRICIDCTNGPDRADTISSANTFIPSPKGDDPDVCPPIHYATVFQRHLWHLWRYRITFPSTNILQHCDDVDAAFRRVLYTPELAIAFAYVFGQDLLIPVGQVFGSRLAPSYFSLLSLILAPMLPPVRTLSQATRYTRWQQPPSSHLSRYPSSLAPAVGESLSPDLTSLEASSHSNCCFVDNNGVAGLRNYRSHQRLPFLGPARQLTAVDEQGTSQWSDALQLC
jgi:hypothetical protein